MAPDPLRNACNTERLIQIRLDLSLTEGRQLQHWLSDALQTASQGPPVDGHLHHALQCVLAKLTAATDQAVRRVQCPVCHEWFAQGRLGRSAQYCGAACKQKAYRQRRSARIRQWPAPSRRN